MACSGVLTPPLPPEKVPPPPPQIGNPLSPKIPPPSPQTFYSPPLTGNGCFCIFHTWLLPTSTCSYF